MVDTRRYKFTFSFCVSIWVISLSFKFTDSLLYLLASPLEVCFSVLLWFSFVVFQFDSYRVPPLCEITHLILHALKTSPLELYYICLSYLNSLSCSSDIPVIPEFGSSNDFILWLGIVFFFSSSFCMPSDFFVESQHLD